MTPRAREECLAREALHRAVHHAVIALGQGFLAHPENELLRAALRAGALSAATYWCELLRLVYRLIFVLTAEERGMLHGPGAGELARSLYRDAYSLHGLCDRAASAGDSHRIADPWEATTAVLRGLDEGQPRLGLPPLGGIFAERAPSALAGAKLDGRVLCSAILTLCGQPDEWGARPVCLRDTSAEALGSVYASLLELVPQITPDGRLLSFATDGDAKDNARKASGSYYTPDRLVQVLLDQALEPVIREAAAARPDSPVEALLDLAIVDPACGSGHFLLAAARRLAWHVARFSANDSPSAAELHQAFRQVISRCIYGVDLNPMAVDLCIVNLWNEAATAGLPLTSLEGHIQHGNAIFGANTEAMAAGVPDAAWELVEGDDKKTASVLRKRNKSAAVGVLSLERSTRAGPGISGGGPHEKLVADAWCAAFVWPKTPGPLADVAPTNELWRPLREGGALPEPATKTVRELARAHGFFHWPLRFPEVFAKGGFDVVLGNPPWVAHAGRAAKPLPAGAKRFYEWAYEAFAEYPTTHGIFASSLPRVLRLGGRLGLVVPASMSELRGYGPTRRAHDRLCEFTEELVDFGEGCFEGVTQPCMALVSRRSSRGRTDAAWGEPWPVARPDLSDADRRLLARLAALPKVPAELFGERGVQSDRSLAEHFAASAVPVGRFATPIREGTDVREFELLAPRSHVDRHGLGGRIRSSDDFAAVRLLIRQTARYPIAAASDGGAFRNSLLAGFALPGWPPEALVALLNSSLVRWAHYMRFRDARQPVMPQVKVAHLRAIPVPIAGLGESLAELASLGQRMSERAQTEEVVALREALDRLVANTYDLTDEDRAIVQRWHEEMGPRRRGGRAAGQ